MAINNLSDLRRELCESIERVKKDRAYVPQAVEITNAAGKIINTLRVEMDYYKLTKMPPPPSRFLLGDKPVENPNPEISGVSSAERNP